MTLRDGQERLFRIWLIGSLPTFLILFTRSLGTWRDDVFGVWGWFATVLGPMLSFMVSAYIAGRRNRSIAKRAADQTLYQAARIGSMIYLILVFGVLFAANSVDAALEFMRDAELGLGVAQGTVAALLGYFHLAAK